MQIPESSLRSEISVISTRIEPFTAIARHASGGLQLRVNAG
jgi:hypothetical protein